MQKPPKLNPGDTVATISLSWGGAQLFPQRYQQGKRQLEQSFGVRVVESRHTLKSPEWLANNPQARAKDLMEVVSDPNIKAIISNIGGNDSIRMLPYLDLEVLRKNPKIFMGYSDTTISHFAFFKAGVVSFYGPAILAGFAENGGVFPYTEDSVRRSLFQSDPIGELVENRAGWTVEHLDWGDPHLQRPRQLQPNTGWRWLQGQGVQQGRLIGGCIEVLDWLRGTQLWPTAEEWRDAVLFLETSEEAPSPEAVLYMLRCLGALGVLQSSRGLLFGRPGGTALNDEERRAYDDVLLRATRNELGLHDLPIISNLDFGHTDPIMVLPYGLQTEIDCEQQRIRILESAVSEC